MTSAPPKKENLLLSVICNIAIPILIMTRFSTDRWLGPVWGTVVAVSFPLTYGIRDYVVRGKTNFFSVIGTVSVLLTGGLNLLKVGAFWMAVKEAAVPLVIGAAVVLSTKTKRPLIRELMYNDQIIDVERVDAEIAAQGKKREFDALFVKANWLVGASFLLSAVLNFGLARYLLRSEPGTPEFNAEIGQMIGYSIPVIAVPSGLVMMIAVWQLLTGLKALTGLTLDQIFRAETKAKKA